MSVDRPRVAFVCRGSPAEGLGHLTRTAAIEAATRAHADTLVVSLGDAALADRILGGGLRAGDDQEAAEMAISFDPGAVVFDTTRFDDGAYAVCTRHAAGVSVSPVFDRMGSVEALFQRARRAPVGLPASGVEVFAGAAYTVVRPGVRRISDDEYTHALDEDRLSVALNMGGGDAENWTVDLVKRLVALERPMLLWVMLGEGYEHSADWLLGASANGNGHEVIVVRARESMWRVLSRCSLALLAAGTVTSEAVYAGLPSVNMLRDPAHRFLVEDLEASGALDVETGFEGMVSTVERLERERDALRAMRDAGAGMIDGNGASRIAREIARIADDGVRVTSPVITRMGA